MSEVVSADELSQQICEALSIPHDIVGRIVIDINDGWPMVYVEMVGSRQLLDVDWMEGLSGVQVKVLEK